MQTVLSSLTILRIRGKYSSGVSSAHLDNVVLGEALGVSSRALSFTFQPGAGPPSSQSLLLTSNSPLPFTATAVSTGNWLSVSPRTGTTPATITISVNPSALTAGSYDGSIRITGSAPTVTGTVNVTLNVSGTNTPAISESGVVNGASFGAGIAAGSWVSIFGQNLAATRSPGRIWRDSEIINGVLPASLDGTSVRINNKPAAVYFVSPGQLNVQAPDDNSLGPVPVEVTTPTGVARTTAELKQFAPALFVGRAAGDESQGRAYAAAVHADGVLVGRPEILAGARAARPGDIILLFGTGFGPSDPVRPTGRVIEPSPLANPFTIRIGDLPATALYGGLVGAGLYQFNVRVPELPDGDQAVSIEIGGMSTKTGVLLPILH